MNFTLESYFNPHMTIGSTRLDAIISVSANNDNLSEMAVGGKKAVGFVIDTSGSMDGEKIAQGKSTLRKCIQSLDEECYFFIISFCHTSDVIVPMTLATPKAKKNADEVIKKLYASGGTVMSTALLTALKQFKSIDSKVIGYVQFITDGENDESDVKNLNKALSGCEGKFQCDCWGIGTGWRPDELRKISERLLGSADAVPDPETLEMHFKGALARISGKGLSNVSLRLQVPRTSKILSIKQMSPEIVDVTKLSRKFDDKNTDVPLGSWGTESRDYHVAFELEAQADGEEMMVCLPKIVYAQNDSDIEVKGQRIVAAWTMDESLTARINSQVAHYTGQEELASSIREGLEAKSRGDIEQATVLLGRAAKIAIQSGNDEVTRRLKKVVDVVDADQGTVRLRTGSNKGADLELDMGGTRTIRRRPLQGGEVK